MVLDARAMGELVTTINNVLSRSKLTAGSGITLSVSSTTGEVTISVSDPFIPVGDIDIGSNSILTTDYSINQSNSQGQYSSTILVKPTTIDTIGEISLQSSGNADQSAITVYAGDDATTDPWIGITIDASRAELISIQKPFSINVGSAIRWTWATNGNLTIPDAKNIVLDTSTGTKIGTAANQKLGFYNAAPVVQPTTIADADGTLADITTKFNSLLAKMEALGLLAS